MRLSSPLIDAAKPPKFLEDESPMLRRDDAIKVKNNQLLRMSELTLYSRQSVMGRDKFAPRHAIADTKNVRAISRILGHIVSILLLFPIAELDITPDQLPQTLRLCLLSKTRTWLLTKLLFSLCTALHAQTLICQHVVRQRRRPRSPRG